MLMIVSTTLIHTLFDTLIDKLIHTLIVSTNIMDILVEY